MRFIRSEPGLAVRTQSRVTNSQSVIIGKPRQLHVQWQLVINMEMLNIHIIPLDVL